MRVQLTNGESNLSAVSHEEATSSPPAVSVVEAVLFTGGPALSLQHLKEFLETNDEDEIVSAVSQLNQLYHRQGRPYEIRRAVQGYQMVLRGRFTSVARRLHSRTREVRLSVAAVEVLSLVAYRQPVTLHEIDAARGVDSAAIIRQLRRRNLIDAVESETSGGRAIQFQTTRRFLELFHLTSLDELPRVQELEKP